MAENVKKLTLYESSLKARNCSFVSELKMASSNGTNVLSPDVSNPAKENAAYSRLSLSVFLLKVSSLSPKGNWCYAEGIEDEYIV